MNFSRRGCSAARGLRPRYAPKVSVEPGDRSSPPANGDVATRLAPAEYLRLVVGVLAVALGAAAFAVAFRLALSAVYRTLGGRDVLEVFSRVPWWWRLILPSAGGLVAGLLARWSPAGGGVGEVMEAVALGRGRLVLRETLWKAGGSFAAIAGGGSIGREGPLIQFGGSFGSTIARVMQLSDRPTRALIAAGTAAGFAAAYNTPLAAILFVLEIVTGIVVVDTLLAVMIATAIATAITRAAAGGGPIYGSRTFLLAKPTELLAYAALGLVAALGAQVFMRTLSAGERVSSRAALGQPWRAMFGGLIVGAVAMMLPEVTGNGYEPLNHLLDGAYSGSFILALLLLKMIATTASVSSGAPGGVFTPSLLVGGAVGGLFGRAIALGASGAVAPESYALVGMAAAVAATTHAPLMASVLVFELSGDYALALPLVLATAVATLVSRALRPDSIYAAELRRRGIGWEMTHEGRQLQ